MKILIVGAGPCGLILSSQLEKQGIMVDLIDKRTKAISFSKALSVSAATLKVFHGMGIIDRFLHQGNLIQDVNIYYNTKRTMHINMRYLEKPYNYFLSIPQPKTEEILQDHYYSLGGRINFGTELIAINKISTGKIYVTFKKNDQKTEEKEYDYIIACDGAKSTVRELLQISFLGRDYAMYFQMADVRWKTVAKTKEQAEYYIDQQGFLIAIHMKNDVTRLVVKIDGKMPADRGPLSKQEMQLFVDRYLGTQCQIADVIWASGAPFYNRIAGTCYEDNIFLVGDAMHLFSPIGGQGMNTGIQDAFNLSWRIGAYMNGFADKKILAEYARERIYAVMMVLSRTDKHTELIANLSNIDKEEFMPTFSNRSVMRNELAQIFSGYKSDYQGLYSQNDDEDWTIKVGQHIPFWELKHSLCKNTYDIPNIGKFFIVLNTSSQINQNWINLEKKYSNLLTISQLTEPSTRIDQLPGFVLIRPDGYVGGLGGVNESEKCLQLIRGFGFYV